MEQEGAHLCGDQDLPGDSGKSPGSVSCDWPAASFLSANPRREAVKWEILRELLWGEWHNLLRSLPVIGQLQVFSKPIAGEELWGGNSWGNGCEGSDTASSDLFLWLVSCRFPLSQSQERSCKAGTAEVPSAWWVTRPPQTCSHGNLLKDELFQRRALCCPGAPEGLKNPWVTQPLQIPSCDWPAAGFLSANPRRGPVKRELLR